MSAKYCPTPPPSVIASVPLRVMLLERADSVRGTGRQPGIRLRFIADELPEKSIVACENKIQRLCRYHGISSVLFKKRRLTRKPGPPHLDDLVARDLAASAPNLLWLTDITERPTAEGKLYLCAVKDVYSVMIVGCSTG